MRQILIDGLDSLGVPYGEAALEGFEKYAEHLSRRNAVMNLTAITEPEDVARLHFLDCAALLKIYDFSSASVIDIGSGAGFPGLPLKLLSPDIDLTLLDSHGKKVDFLREVRNLLGLERVRCEKARAEEAALDMEGGFDIAVSRAVARLNVLCELCLPFVRSGGAFIAMKGPDCSGELEESRRAIQLLGGGRTRVEKYTIPGTDIVHSAVIIEKKRPTPPQYPRAFGKIKSSPLK